MHKIVIVMRIPNEALPFPQRESETPADAKEKNTKPVAGTAQIRSALSDLLPGAGHPPNSNADSDEENPGATQNGRKNRDQPATPERRHDERRKANWPVLLDTRTAQTRRRSSRTPTINVKI